MAGLWATLKQRRLWLLFLCFFLMMAGLAIMSPHLTPVSVNYFANVSLEGIAINCGDFSAGEAPLACVRGSTVAVRYVSVASFFCNSVLGLAVSPIVGWLSDSYGRKPFFLAALVLNALPFVWVAAYLHTEGGISFIGFYFMDTLKGMVVPLSLVMSATADVAEPGLRATLFSGVMLELSVAMILAAIVGGQLSPVAAANTSVVLFACSIVLFAGFMPETLSKRAKIRRDESPTSTSLGTPTARSMICTVWEGYKDSLSVLTRNQLFFKLALIMAASGIVFECIMDLLFNYLIVTMGFQAEQNGNVLMILGICGLIVQGLLLPGLLKVMPEKWILVTALVSSTFEMIGFVLAPALDAWAVYLSVVVGAPGSMAFPIISALKSVHAGADEQGKVQGALFAARGVAQGSGPLMFSFVFSFFTQKGSHYFPGAPIVGLAIIMTIGAGIACSIRIPAKPTSSTALEHVDGAGDVASPHQEERIELLHKGLELDKSTTAPVVSLETQ